MKYETYDKSNRKDIFVTCASIWNMWQSSNVPIHINRYFKQAAANFSCIKFSSKFHRDSWTQQLAICAVLWKTHLSAYVWKHNVQFTCHSKPQSLKTGWLTVITLKVTQSHSSSLEATLVSGCHSFEPIMSQKRHSFWAENATKTSQFLSQLCRSRSLEQVLIVLVGCEVVDLGTETKKCEFWNFCQHAPKCSPHFR